MFLSFLFVVVVVVVSFHSLFILFSFFKKIYSIDKLDGMVSSFNFSFLNRATMKRLTVFKDLCLMFVHFCFDLHSTRL